MANLRAAFDALVAGRKLDAESDKIAYRISQQLKNAERKERRRTVLSAVERKLLLEDVDTLTRLLAATRAADCVVGPGGAA